MADLEIPTVWGESVPWAPLMAEYRRYAEQLAGDRFESFEALHRWSIDRAETFWRSLWAFDRIPSRGLSGAMLDLSRMPGARWFDGAGVNYVRQVLRHVEPAHAAGHPAIIAEDEMGAVETVDWPTLRARVASLARTLRELGVGRGDRVAAYLPNRPEAIIGLLACASIGAIWSICAPDMGVPAIVDRFRQIEPRVLIATDGVFYAGKAIDRVEVVETLRKALPSVATVLLVRSGHGSRVIPDVVDFAALSGSTLVSTEDATSFEPEWVPFDHPLWILYSSGTTGKPKALVHGHGGMLLTAAAGRLHSDIGASYDRRTPGERFYWFSSTGWMMWNMQVNGLLCGTTICIFDGSPSGARDRQDWGLLWRFAARHRVTFFGSGAQYYAQCDRVGLDFAAAGDLSALRALGSTASPLPARVQTRIGERLRTAGQPAPWWFNSSGGTDIAGAFCTGNRELPEVPGKLQCLQLGAAVETWDADANPVRDEVGELVCTRPLPGMPVFFWNDPQGARYLDAYFSLFPGVWRQGDWLRLEADGTCEIFGRSDATINRGGHRMGTSEIYAAVERIDGVSDALAVDVRVQEGESRLLLFVETEASVPLADPLVQAIGDAIRSSLSPRFVPDAVISVPAIPRTLSSKRMELPIKRLFEGAPVESRDR